MKPFEKWETEEVEQTLGIKLLRDVPLMNDWLAFSQDLTLKDKERSEELRLFLEPFASLWNEEDMKVFFIVPVLQIVNFYALEFGSLWLWQARNTPRAKPLMLLIKMA